MKLFTAFSVLALSLSACSSESASAQNTDASVTPVASASAAPANSLVVAELFTSQGCSSCPSAEKLFSKLAERDDLLTLEWHVDYWDDLVHHGSRWKDPYSDREFTRRQRSYNRSIRGTNAGYTPQAVVNGHFEGVGSRPGTVDNMINKAPAHSISAQITGNELVVGPSSEAVDIVFLRLLDHHETDVKGGENKGRKLSGRNIVLEASVIGKSGPNSTELTLPSVDGNETCAVILQSQNDNLGSVLGAAKC